MGISDDARRRLAVKTAAAQADADAEAAAQKAEEERRRQLTYEITLSDAETRAALSEFVAEMRRIGVQPQPLYHATLTPWMSSWSATGYALGWGLSVGLAQARSEPSIGRFHARYYGGAVTSSARLVKASRHEFTERNVVGPTATNPYYYGSGFSYHGFKPFNYGSPFWVLELLAPTVVRLNSLEAEPFSSTTLREALVATLQDGMEGKLTPEPVEEPTKRGRLRRWWLGN